VGSNRQRVPEGPQRAAPTRLGISEPTTPGGQTSAVFGIPRSVGNDRLRSTSWVSETSLARFVPTQSRPRRPSVLRLPS